MVFYRGVAPPNGAAPLYKPVEGEAETTTEETTTTTEESENWIQNWKQLLKYMRQNIPDEPESHGCMGTNIAARVQEIIASHPSTITGHQNAEAEILQLLKHQ